jgi:hypothetical protein
MRDHELKNAVGRLEDRTTRLLAEIERVMIGASDQGATGHAEYYDEILGHLRCSQGDLYSAYSLLLNGDEARGVEALGDEVTA